MNVGEGVERRRAYASEITDDGKVCPLTVVAVRDADDPKLFRWEFRRTLIVTRRSACTFSNEIEAIMASRAVLHVLNSH